MRTATFLLNRIVSQNLQHQSPLQTLFNSFSLIKLENGLPKRVFGCECYKHLHSNQTKKLSTIALKCVFLGYANTQKGCKCYHPHGPKTRTSRDEDVL